MIGAGGVPIARLFGIEIRISLTWAVLIAIVTLLGAQQTQFTAPDLPGPVQWAVGGIIAFGFLASVIAHELSHALLGRRYGIEQRSITLGFVGGLAPLNIQAPTPRAGRVCSNAFWSRLASISLPILAAMASRSRNHSLHTMVS